MKKLLLLSGLLSVSVLTNAQQRFVLYEEFSGENCGPCAATNPGLWTLLNGGTNPSKIMLIKYQTPIPSGGPIYYQNTGDVDARTTYYTVPFAPYARMDGDVSPGATAPANAGHPGYLTQAHIDAAAGIASPFNMTVNYTVTGTSISGNVNITAVSAYTGSNVKVRVALVETLIYTSPPGTNGETEFHHVVRKMYPGPDGSAIANTFTVGQTATVPISGIIPSYVDRTHELFLVAWIQNDGDKKIAQTAKSANLPPVPLDAGIVSAAPSIACGSATVDHKVKIKNTGTTALTQATLFYKIGTGAYQAAPNWTGTLAAGQTSADITIGTLTLPGGGATITDSIGTLNAAADNNPANNTFTSSALALASGAGLPQSTGFEGAGVPSGYIIFDKDGKYVAEPAFNAETWFNHSEAAIKGQANSAYTCIAPCANMETGKTTVITFPYTNAPAGAKAVDFYYAYAQRGTITGDKLDLVYSTDCGQNWTSVWSKANADLAGGNPATPETGLFLPDAESDWKFASVDVTAINGNALVGFRATSGGGNLIFIDNVKFRTGAPGPLGIEEVINGGNVSVYPNPVSDRINVELNMVKSARVTFNITNVVGQQIGQPLVKTMTAGQNNTRISTNNLAPGVYFLNVITEQGSIKEKFVKL